MRFLHTADWHVGKTLRGRSRADEHRAVLDEIAGIADERRVDAVLIAGDLFDSAAPSPEAEEIVYRAVLRLAARPVIVIAGNHDNPRRFSAVRPLLELGNVTALPSPSKPDEGGTVLIESPAGERTRISLLPFVSQRGIVDAQALMERDADQHAQTYAQRLATVVAALCENADEDAVGILVGHAMVHGGKMGGGERSAHTVFEYSIPATAFPGHLHYVALGHLHRAQRIDARCPVHYSGSPLQLDFGETEDRKSVNVVDAVMGRPAAIETVPLKAGRNLRRIEGTLCTLRNQAQEAGSDYLLVEVQEAPRLGLADEVRELLPNAVEVRIAHPESDSGDPPAPETAQAPQELFGEYLAQRHGDKVFDAKVAALFAELLDDAQ